jgi:hypothetical protein
MAVRYGLVDNRDGFVCDDVYGSKAVRRMRAYQRNIGKIPDGGCGPVMRDQMMIRDNFDIYLVAQNLPGTTVFVQRDRSKIAWSRETGAVPVGPDPKQGTLALTEAAPTAKEYTGV